MMQTWCWNHLTSTCRRDVKFKTCQNWSLRHMKWLLQNEGMGRVSPVQLLPSLGSHGITVLLQLALTSGNGSAQSFTTTSQIQSVAASHWHSLPLGTGTFHAACLGVLSLCVSCKSHASPAPGNDDVTKRMMSTKPESKTLIV